MAADVNLDIYVLQENISNRYDISIGLIILQDIA